MAEIASELDDINRRLEVKFRSIDQNNFNQCQNALKDLRTLLTEYNKKLNELDNELQGDDDEKNLMVRLKNHQAEYNLKKTKVNKLDEKVTAMANNQKFQRGELTGQDARKAERSAIVDLHKETDFQEELISSIASDVKGANDDLKEAGIEVKKQGDQIERIDVKVNEGISTVKRTDQAINQMSRKAFCMKALLWLLIALLLLTNIGVLIWKLIKIFK